MFIWILGLIIIWHTIGTMINHIWPFQGRVIIPILAAKVLFRKFKLSKISRNIINLLLLLIMFL